MSRHRSPARHRVFAYAEYFVMGIAVALRAIPAAAQVVPRATRETPSVAPRETCFDSALVDAQLAFWLHNRPLDPALRVSITGPVMATQGASFRLERDGMVVAERHFAPSAAPCPDQRAAVTLAVALAIDPHVLTEVAVPRPDPPLPIRPAAATPRAEPRPLLAPRLRLSRPEISLGLGAGAAVVFGVLAVPVVLFRGEVVLALGRYVELRAGASATLPATMRVGSGSAEISVAAGHITTCIQRDTVPWLSLFGCVGFALGAASAQGRGFHEVFAETNWWGTASAGLGLQIRLARVFALRASVEGWLAVLRPRLDVTDETNGLIASELLPPGALALIVGPVVTFW